MASFNKIILVGNLTRDPELSYTPANTAICKFGLATNHKWRDKEGNTREDVCFVECTLFAKSAEVFNEHMAKGRSVLVEGRLRLEQWTSQDGQKRSRHSVAVDRFTFLGDKGGQADDHSRPAPAEPQASPMADDDIPF